MKRFFLMIGVILLDLNLLFGQNDSLNVVFEFNSPSANPWGLSFDGTNFWISDHNSGKIFKSSPTGQTIDSIEVVNSKITGLSFVNDTLWALNTNIVKYTIINSSSYPVYSIYKIDKSNGNKVDSIEIIGSAVNLKSVDLWGLEFYNGKFYVSYNGGWGPCLFEIERNGIYSDLCCTHLLGMTVAYDSIWAIGQGGHNITVTNGTQEKRKYKIACNATDITFDGANFWVIDTNDNKIKKLEGLTTSIRVLNEIDDVQILSNSTTDYILLPNETNSNIKRIMISDINGRIVEIIPSNKCDGQKIEISHLLKGIYIMTLTSDNKEIIKKIVKN